MDFKYLSFNSTRLFFYLIGLVFSIVTNQNAKAIEMNPKIYDEIVSAAISLNEEKLNQLKQQNGHLNFLSQNGTNAALEITRKNKLAALELLITFNIDIDARNEELIRQANIIDPTPFLLAGAKGLSEFIKPLFDAGSDPSIVNFYGGTALIPAAEKGHVETVRALLEYSDVDINHVNRLGWTALLESVILSKQSPQQTSIVELLLEYGADKEIADNQGVTALQHAKSKGLIEIIQLLE